MITLHLSYWWLLLPLAIFLIAIVACQDTGGGFGGGLLAVFVALVCLAVFLIVLACLVGYTLGHHG
jgi:hypothetical protein